VGGAERTYTRVDDVPVGSIFKHSMYVQKNAAASMFCKQLFELAGQGVAGELFVGQVVTCSGYLKCSVGSEIALITRFREEANGGDIVEDLPQTVVTTGDGDWQYFEKTWTVSSSPSSLSRAYEVNFTTNQDPTNTEMWLTGIQLEIGQQATPYEDIFIGELIALCQRYYQMVDIRSYEIMPIGRASSGNTITSAKIPLPVRMRTTPTVETKSLPIRAFRLANGTVIGPGTRSVTPVANNATYKWQVSGWGSAAITPQPYALMVDVATPNNPEEFGLEAEL
jgi:hypothetical protein